jgi:hypothetical protein
VENFLFLFVASCGDVLAELSVLNEDDFYNVSVCVLKVL